MTKAYSYLRFSTPEQAKGDSDRRQTEAAAAYAAQHGLELDTALSLRDPGVSAFRGANVAEGALGRFIEAVDNGRVEAGSYLLIEDLDRLSRQTLRNAHRLFSDLLDKGINIVSLSDNKVYNSDSLDDLRDLIWFLLGAARSHEHSKRKSELMKEVWANKKQRAATEGHKLSARAPAWLLLNDGQFVVREDRAAVIRRIFQMALEGHGKWAIARALNAEGVQPWGDGKNGARKGDAWHPAYINKILRSPAVIGHYQPMKRAWKDNRKDYEPDGPILTSYFPPVIDENSFYRVQGAKPGVSAKKGKVSNVLSGLVFCASCKGPMHFINKGARNGNSSQLYFCCDNARRKRTCNAKGVKYDKVVPDVLSTVLHWNGIKQKSPDDRKQELRNNLDGIEGRLQETERAIDNLMDTLERVPSSAIEKRLANHEASLKLLRQEKAELETAFHSLNADTQERDIAADVEAFNRKQELPSDSVLVAVQLNAALKRVVNRIELLFQDKQTGISLYMRDNTGVAYAGIEYAMAIDSGRLSAKVLESETDTLRKERRKLAGEG